MTPKQRLLAIRLSEKIAKNPDYAKIIGIETADRGKGGEERQKTTAKDVFND